MMTIEEIFADDLRNPPTERSLPWEETRDGVAVVVEPKPHWSADMRAFRREAREYCHYLDWIENGSRARFYSHIDTSGDDVMAKVSTMIADGIAGGLWSR